MEDSPWQYFFLSYDGYKLLNLLDIRSSYMPKVLALVVHGPDRAFSYPHFFAGVNCALRRINFERLGKLA